MEPGTCDQCTISVEYDEEARQRQVSPRLPHARTLVVSQSDVEAWLVLWLRLALRHTVCGAAAPNIPCHSLHSRQHYKCIFSRPRLLPSYYDTTFCSEDGVGLAACVLKPNYAHTRIPVTIHQQLSSSFGQRSVRHLDESKLRLRKAQTGQCWSRNTGVQHDAV